MARYVLLADDSTTLHRIVRDILEPDGFEVHCVDNGEDAFLALKASPPAMVLADLSMPRMGGLELCELAHREELARGIPFIFLVGPFDEYSEDAAARVGGNGHLIKPFDAYRLLTLVRRLVPQEVPASSGEDLEELSDPLALTQEVSETSVPLAEALPPPPIESTDDVSDLPEAEQLEQVRDAEALPEGLVAIELSEAERVLTDDSDNPDDLEEVSPHDDDDSEELALPLEAVSPSPVIEGVRQEVRTRLARMGGEALIEEMLEQVIREEVARLLPKVVEQVVRSRIHELELEVETLAGESERGEI